MSSSPLSGIISYLTTKHGGNVSDKNIMTIKASGVFSGCSAKNAADLTANSFWHSNNEDNLGFAAISKICESNQHTALFDRDITEAMLGIN
jgi:hypothetical protein